MSIDLSSDDLNTILKTVLEMATAERLAYLNEKVDTDTQQPKTVAQKIYGMIYRQEQKKEVAATKTKETYTFDPFNSGIDNYFSNKQLAEEFRSLLKTHRQQRQAEIKQAAINSGLSLYHISSVPPEKIEGGTLRARWQKEHFRDQGDVTAVFASSDNNWAMALKLGGRVPGGIATSVSSSSLFGTKKIVTVSDKNKFLNYKSRHPYSYQYKFSPDLFEPNVGYNGIFNGEWYRERDLKIDANHCEKKSVDEIVSTDADLYFITPGHVKNVCAQLSSLTPDIIGQLAERGILTPYEIGDIKKWRKERQVELNNLLNVLGKRLENLNSENVSDKKVSPQKQPVQSEGR